MSDKSTREANLLLMNAALDGELDALEYAEFERALADDPELAAAWARAKALQGALRAQAEMHKTPETLRAAIIAMAGDEDRGATRRAPPRSASSWRPRMAWAAVVVVAFFGGAVGRGVLTNVMTNPADRVASLLVDDHRRALLAPTPIDIASSDRHTVKPWFDARLALSPPVVDLGPKGYLLVGGRADVVEGVPAPVIVYRFREHYVSLTALPQAKFAAPTRLVSMDGYELISWLGEGFVFEAVSDMPLSDLEAFAADYRAGVQANEADH